MCYLLSVIVIIGCFDATAAASEVSVNIKDFDNYVCKTNDVVFSLPAVSPIHCANMCSANPLCKNVFYKSGTSTCTGCDTFYTSLSPLAPDSGSVYYVPIDADPACNTPSRNFRLCDGSGPGLGHPSQGRIEILYNRTWWSVCDDCWDAECVAGLNPAHNLNTICRTFGLTGVSIHTQNYFGDNTKPLLIENVECQQTEDTIWDCPLIGPSLNIGCGLHEAVGVICN